MNRKSVWLILTFFALCAVALAQAGPVQIVTDVPFNDVGADPCTHEVVNYTGAVHTVTTTVIDAKGGVHVIMNVSNQNITGVGLTSGNQYRWVGAATSSSNIRPPTFFPAETTFTFKFNVISPGSTNENALEMFHVTLNADGTLLQPISIKEYQLVCN